MSFLGDTFLYFYHCIQFVIVCSFFTNANNDHGYIQSIIIHKYGCFSLLKKITFKVFFMIEHLF